MLSCPQHKIKCFAHPQLAAADAAVKLKIIAAIKEGNFRYFRNHNGPAYCLLLPNFATLFVFTFLFVAAAAAAIVCVQYASIISKRAN